MRGCAAEGGKINVDVPTDGDYWKAHLERKVKKKTFLINFYEDLIVFFFNPDPPTHVLSQLLVLSAI